jgi:hypothetical protein
VPRERVSMRKLRELLRLHFDLKLSQHQIARSINIGQSTVSDYLARFTRAGLSWPLPVELTEMELQSALFPAVAKFQQAHANPELPDWSYIHQELQQHKHTTLQLLWGEYRARRLFLWSLLLSLRMLEAMAEPGHAPRASSGREAVRRLGG